MRNDNHDSDSEKQSDRDSNADFHRSVSFYKLVINAVIVALRAVRGQGVSCDVT